MDLDEPFTIVTRAEVDDLLAGGAPYLRVDEHGVTRYMGLRVVIVEPSAPVHCLDELFPAPAEKNSNPSGGC
jgi:hypothetical protein